MAAESPRKTTRGPGLVVRPQAVSEKTVMESVVNFFQDVAYSHGKPHINDHEKVLWVSFEKADINDINSNPDCRFQNNTIAPLLLVLGYSNGVQMWSIPSSGEAQEVFSVRQGPVRVLRLLPTPETVHGRQDNYVGKRPLVALCDASSAGQPYCSVKFISLRSGDELHNISFKNPVVDVKCNSRVVCVAFRERVAAFDSCQFKQLFCITSCYPCPGPIENPIALGTRWMAYADNKLVAVHQSCGGMTGDGGQSYTATVISAAKTITKGLTMFGETVASSLTGTKIHSSSKKKDGSEQNINGHRPGIVTVIDIQNAQGEVSVQEDCEGTGLVAHFPAHVAEPVAAMNFDPSGILLVTADKLGHNFHVFRIMAHPISCSLGAVHHMYTLYRGDTTAKVQDISFTHDSRWVAVSTWRGTSHIFPITPYGGPVTVRTHTSQQVVNRASRFHRSAGLDELPQGQQQTGAGGRLASSGRDSPGPSPSPSSSPGHHDHLRSVMQNNSMNNNISNPRLPPYPHPTMLIPLAQIKHALSIPGLGGSNTGPGSGAGTGSKASSRSMTQTRLDRLCVVTCFAPSRGWVCSSPGLMREKPEERRSVDSLYILNWMGNLVEYILEPHVKSGLDKLTEESPLEVCEAPRAQWSLCRCTNTTELRPPLTNNNPIILACDAVASQTPSELSSGSGQVSRNASQESLSSEHSLGDDQWLSQVEIITHSGPHRRLWMGPQFSFKTFQGSGTVVSSSSSCLLSQSPEAQLITAMDTVSEQLDLHSLRISEQTGSRSSPMAMPGSRRHNPRRCSSGSDHTPSPSTAPFLIEAGSYEQPGGLLEAYSSWPESAPPVVATGESTDEQLREHLAEAMCEPSAQHHVHAAARELWLQQAKMSRESREVVEQCQKQMDQAVSAQWSLDSIPVPQRPASLHEADRRTDGDRGSAETLSTCSSGSAGSACRPTMSYDVKPSPPVSMEHVLVFPSATGSPDSN